MSHHPHDHDRPPREKMYEEETEQIIEAIKNRGDQRIGQLILNAIRGDTKTKPPKNPDSIDEIQDARQKIHHEEWNYLWNIEADQLLERMKKRGYTEDPSFSKQNSNQN